MTLVNIDLRNQGYETGPDDRVVFYSLLVREGDFGTISTAPVEVELVDGKATVDLAPGPVGVQIVARQVADTRIKIGEVPPSGPTTLGAVMMVTPAYTPALQKMMIAAIERAKEIAVGQVDGAVSTAIDAEVGEFKTKAEQALTKSTAAESKSDAALSKSTTAESSAGNAVSRVSALEAMSGLSPESPVDGQTANLVSQPDTLTRAAITETALGLVDYVSPSGLSQHAAFLQGKIDALEASGGGTLNLMPGVYNINATLSIPNKVSLRGLDQQAVTLDASSLPADTPAIWVMPESTGNNLENFWLRAYSGKRAIGILYGRYGESEGAVADFTASSIKIEGFKVGISASFAWCGVFKNVRVHVCTTALKFGPQMNAIEFNGWITNFSETGVDLSNVEGITFNTASFESTVSTGNAIRMFQSQAVLVQPYFEHTPKLAQVGAASEAQGATSSLVITNGRICGTLTLGGPDCQVTVTSPWVIHSGSGTPFAIDMDGGLGNQPRQIRVDDFSLPSDGVRVISRWDARDEVWGLQSAYGGAGVTHTLHPSHATATSPTAAQGIKIGDLVVGKQYVFSYRMRKTDGGVNIREGDRATSSIRKVSEADSDFRVVHTPFIARGNVLRMMWQGDLDLQWFSLTEGLNFLDRT